MSQIMVLILWNLVYGQVVTWEPEFYTQHDSVTIYFHADQGNQALEGYTGTVYAHTG